MIRTITRFLFWIAVLAFTWYALSAIATDADEAMPLAVGAAIILIAVTIALGRRRQLR